MKQTIEVGRRIELAKNFEAFFTAPHSRKPVMDNRDFHLGSKNKKAKGNSQEASLTDVCLLPYDFISILLRITEFHSIDS
jgi:hypothetical protein